MNIKELAKLGELIEVLGRDGLEIQLNKYNQTSRVVNETMSRLPKRFHVQSGKHGSSKWKTANVNNMFEVANVEVSMFYSKEKEEGR